MRPIQLTMSAFGPYSGLEVIDFNELQARNLFLITGATGSGKTTIFDAISYALYGKASGDLRTEDNLRSHFSPEDLLTEVTLLFELGGLKYQVHRIPKQMRPKARAEGMTEQKPDATLTIDVEGKAKVIAGVSKVTKQIELILGINEEQFKQIMMIPQGEFRKLLTSDSQEREKVLQQLFDTYAYRKIQYELNDKAKELGGGIKGQKVARDTLISQIKTGEDHDLYQLIHSDDKFVDKICELTQDLIAQDTQKIEEVLKKITSINEAIKTTIHLQTKVKEDNKSLISKKAFQDQLQEEEARIEEMNLKAQKVLQGEKASLLTEAENNIKARRVEISTHEEALQLARKSLVQLGEERATISKLYKEETSEAKETQRKEDHLKLVNYRAFIDKVKGLEALNGRIKEDEKAFDMALKKIEGNKEQKHKASLQLERFNEEIDKLKDVAIALEKAQNKRKDQRQYSDQLEGLHRQFSELVKVEANRQSAQAHVKESQGNANESQRSYKEAKLIFLMNQAAVIAQDLKLGQACPVCGSVDHPQLAMQPPTMVSKDQLETLEAKMSKGINGHLKAQEQLSVIEERYKNGLRSINVLLSDLVEDEDRGVLSQPMKDQSKWLDQAMIDKKKDLENLDLTILALEEKSKSFDTLKARVAKGLAYVTTLDSDLKDLNESRLSLTAELANLKTKLQHIHEEVPEDLRHMDKLKASLVALESDIKASSSRLSRTMESFEKVNAQYNQMVAKEQQLSKSLEQAKDTLTSLEESFELKVLEQGFADLDTYALAKMDDKQRQMIKDEVTTFRRNMDRITENIKLLEEKTRGLEIRSLDEFDEKLGVLENERKTLTDKEGGLKSRIEDNRATLASVVKMTDSIKDREAEYNVIGKLARIAQGNNPAMITFERYVLAAFLEDILTAANIRLRQMTQGRYILSRTSQLQRKNKQSGLELEVFDNFTGRSRHVKTLSGGEGFKASLSMALGLSDVVQSYAGGVRLDTMFIDEGFGTLDQESLDSAIDCLIDLQKSGRLVGIISHVQELKERIDTRLEIRSGHTGSETQFVLN